jgi:putative methanogenesis marker protein 12
LPEGVHFQIERERLGDTSVLKEIEKRVPLDNIELVGLAYSMGDGIDAITPIQEVENRGQLEKTTGEFIGGGTRVFDEIASSGVPAVLLPGLHRCIKCLDPRFKALYSHMASSEKVGLGYHAYLETGVENLIVADISSNTVTIGIKEGRFFGAVDACLGAPGILHGPLDLDAIRRIDSGEITANRAFYSMGVERIGDSGQDILEGRTEKDRLARDALIMGAKIEILGFLGELEPDVIAVSGSAGIHPNVFPRLEETLERVAPLHRLDLYSAAAGAAEIARDILKGEKEFLGIKYKGGGNG